MNDAEQEDANPVFVSHIQWWRYYKGHVVGKAKKGFFVFDERSTKVQFFTDQEKLDEHIKELKLNAPLSKRMTPQDGFNQVFGAMMKNLYEQQLKEIEQGTGISKDLNPAQREAMKKSIEQYLKTLEG
ncbi:hypothetical protein NZK35_24525 [Stieleria sp. ICT_E10.1]|uniref:hypothetical protein n=1 Tax=Stieleria sedimenti TaxID=2976331 RepID=UPI00217F79B8|nr:hypothetical protein [Stieleria sedimenti]MCS7469830.1 hypothetical protein [Stieleria sedimenti]